jgi:hypothetical protein
MAQTLKFGNKVWAAKEESVLAYNDINNNYKPLPFFFKRTSIGTRVNKDGLIETMGQDIARIDYTDSADGVLLLEPASTNRFIQSNQFDTNWLISNASLLSGQTGVGGSLNAWKLTENSSAAEHFVRQTPIIGGVVSVSVYAKAGTNDFLYLRGVTSGVNIRTWFNLKTGVVGTIQSTSAIMKSMGNGWYRCTMVLTHDSAFEYYIGMSNADAVSTYQGDGTGSIFIQYAQLEQLSYPTSYIPTSGSTVTRAADTCNNSGNSEVFNDSEGVLFLNLSVLANDLSNRWISISQNSVYTDNQINFRYASGSNLVQVVSRAGGLGQDVVMSYTLYDVTMPTKVAIKYELNNWKLLVNGFVVDTETSSNAFTPNSLDVLDFDRGNNTNNFYGKTKEIAYYDTALTDLELETLTSYRSWVSMVNELNLNIIYNG